MRRLFLDDERNPPSPIWDIARSYDEFVAYIDKHGVPDVISFDHDLGDNEFDGMDCVKFLIEKDLPINMFIVHSMNPVGRENLLGLLKNWKNFKS